MIGWDFYPVVYPRCLQDAYKKFEAVLSSPQSALLTIMRCIWVANLYHCSAPISVFHCSRLEFLSSIHQRSCLGVAFSCAPSFAVAMDPRRAEIKCPARSLMHISSLMMSMLGSGKCSFRFFILQRHGPGNKSVQSSGQSYLSWTG